MDDLGNGKEFKYEDLGSTGKDKKNLNFVNFTLDMLRHTCILSGCDYIDSIPGLGLKKAHALMRQFKDVYKVIQRLSGTQTSYQIPECYQHDFYRAELTFLYQRVFDPITKSLTFLRPIPKEFEELDLNFLGPDLDPDTALKVALGQVDPSSKQDLEDSTFDISSEFPHYLSSNTPDDNFKNGNNSFKNGCSNSTRSKEIQLSSYFSPTQLRKSVPDPPVQNNNLLNYYSKDDTSIFSESIDSFSNLFKTLPM